MRFSWLPLVLVLLVACDPAPPTRPCSSDDDCPASMVCVDGTCAERPDGGTRDGGGDGTDAGPGMALASIVIDPATATLVSVDGSMPEQAFTVIGTYSDGSMRPAPGPTFSIDTPSLGDLDVASGRFVANGIIGGSATVTATVPGPAGVLTATATLTVQLERTILGPGVPMDVADRFAGPLVTDAARSSTILYPLDRAIMPQNVYPADLQWLNGVNGDLFRVRMNKPNATVTAYLLHDGALQNHWPVDAPAWRSLAQTDPDDDAQIRVDRWEAASMEAIEGAPTAIRFARAALTGSVYYWDIVRGRIVRIDDGTATRNEFMPTPPIAMRGEGPCVGCHAVSNSGRYMAGRLGGGENIGGVFDLTTDLTGNPPASIFPLQTTAPTSLRWWFSSWSPDDTRLVVSTDEGGARQLAIYDPINGASVAITGTLPGNSTHPAWSPDGTQIAYISDLDAWGGANRRGNLYTIDVSAPDTIGASRMVHDGNTLAAEAPVGVSDNYPTWAPDSGRIAFAHGGGSRSDTVPSNLVYSALYIMGRDGSDVVRLGNVSAAGQDTGDFQPRFSPFEEGGFFWLSFLSRRDYGNAEVGTRGAQRQQIWITAIRAGSAPGEDPSSVPYWLPGQNPASLNISAYWAPRPCRPDGESCTVGSECCGGDCRPDMSGALVCSPPPPERCRMENETCSTSADCCNGLTCLGNVCVRAPE